MADIWDRIEEYAERPLTSVEKALFVTASAFSAVFIAFFGILMLSDAITALQAIGGAALASGAAGIAIFFVAVRLFRGPRAPRGTVGILIALATDTEAFDSQLRMDFIRTLRHQADRYSGTRSVAVVEYSRRVASSIGDVESADNAMRNARCQLIVFGEARSRPLGGATRHLITPRIRVQHKPISRRLSKKVGVDISRVLPTTVEIMGDDDFVGLALASRFVLIAAQYSIAVAAAVSMDMDYAEELFLRLSEDISDLPRGKYPSTQLRQGIAKHLASINAHKCNRLWRQWEQTRDKQTLARAEEFVDKVLDLVPGSEWGLLSKAVTAFVLRRDTSTAKRCIATCGKRYGTTGTWRYAEAFLHLYEGRLDKARASYRAASRLPTKERSDYLQSELFIHEVIEEEPQRYWLWFGLGAINVLVKDDYALAERAFDSFRQADVKKKYQKHHAWAEDQLEELKRRLEKRAKENGGD